MFFSLWVCFNFCIVYLLFLDWQSLICSLVQVPRKPYELRVFPPILWDFSHYGDIASPAFYLLLCSFKIWQMHRGKTLLFVWALWSHQFCHSSPMSPPIFCGFPTPWLLAVIFCSGKISGPHYWIALCAIILFNNFFQLFHFFSVGPFRFQRPHYNTWK